jgi:glycosyltransferase involved in cell wall biosynthesis
MGYREISRHSAVVSIDSELVSAVIPTHHRPDLVLKAVLSALHQSHALIEVIVVIDGEDEATEMLLAGMGDARLRVISLAVNVGGSEARNIGVRNAQGEWIAFLDDDDEWLPQKIVLQLEAARASEAVFPVVSSSLTVKTPALDFIGARRPYEAGKPLSEHLFCRSDFADGAYAMQTSTLFMRREMMLAIPFRSGLKRHQDWDWLLRASQHPGVGFQMIAEPLTIFRVEDGRASVGRAIDWEFSLQWAREMRQYFTPRAYSFFVATECMSRAAKSKAGRAAYARLAWEFLARGAPTVRSLSWLLAFTCVPRSMRRRGRNLFRKFKAKHKKPLWETRRISTKQSRAAAAIPDTLN